MAVAQISQGALSLDGSESWGVRSFRAADQLARALEDPAVFEANVGRVAGLALDLGVSSLAGVSPVGVRVAEGVSARTGLPLDREQTAGRVLFIDGLINTGIQLAMAMQQAEANGTERAFGLGLLAQTEALSRWRAAGVELLALEAI